MKKMVLLCVLCVLCTLCACNNSKNESEKAEAADTASENSEMVDIQILATSDLHGKFYPWDYSLDSESKSGSVAQLATVISQLRTDNTLVLDAGDQIQDNCADIFMDQTTNPMAHALNDIGYDAWTTGNHEYDYSMDSLKNYISKLDAPLLLANVWDVEGNALGKPYAVFEKSGVKIGVVGAVTPNIQKWSEANLKGCTVTDPVEECRKAVDELDGKVDILVALVHMDLEDEYGTKNSGAKSLAEECPEFDLIIASHGHNAVEGEEINGVLTVENKKQAQTLSQIHLMVEKSKDGCKIVDKTSKLIYVKDYEPDKELTEKLTPYHEQAKEYIHSVIGSLEGGNLTPDNEINGVSQMMLEDSALANLVGEVMTYYSGAEVSSTCIANPDAVLEEGPIRMCDVSLIYKYSSNTIYTFSMTGAQLKDYMEWSARYYQQYHEGDLTVAFNPDIDDFNYDIFSGVIYDINIAKPVGERIENLCWPDGTPVKDDDQFKIAVNNYRAGSQLMNPGVIYSEDNMPKLVDIDVHGSDIGGIRDMVIDYIENVCGGKITPKVDHNWKITGNDWNQELHEKAVEEVNSGKLSVNDDSKKNGTNCIIITESDLK